MGRLTNKDQDRIIADLKKRSTALTGNWRSEVSQRYLRWLDEQVMRGASRQEDITSVSAWRHLTRFLAGMPSLHDEHRADLRGNLVRLGNELHGLILDDTADEAQHRYAASGLLYLLDETDLIPDVNHLPDGREYLDDFYAMGAALRCLGEELDAAR